MSFSAMVSKLQHVSIPVIVLTLKCIQNMSVWQHFLVAYIHYTFVFPVAISSATKSKYHWEMLIRWRYCLATVFIQYPIYAVNLLSAGRKNNGGQSTLGQFFDGLERERITSHKECPMHWHCSSHSLDKFSEFSNSSFIRPQDISAWSLRFREKVKRNCLIPLLLIKF